jgi:hypothetical protein
MTTMVKDMSTLEDSVTMNNAALEELVYKIIRSFFNQTEIWMAYIREKNRE